ncbi:cystathionine beta-lyase [Paraburkholderia silvatlantica]|uniref:Cystathionine beta-lyase n=1 Tax=Paraburkholderia silvatlantica TaxID=321895 RepID=A0A2U1A867_9BURK|nr:cystathionine beta-lyase [Paraburkholderia silvatlantica]MBB2931063.1 cystathionine beta-lyase [Paraburkholderia silvatlantica]PVY28775.1 cystathionine beta-lyase [Paraburkholderia silvatlantica]PXW36412.1 cystathionine beta-lyase [Paraburkholderia silvatlantica]PYE21737.1 cystathionine beta-lyase [Paraburkholderia silvatlantica]TDQ86859.1 cystathionine beta-lyase [Paraburkholderia silvatlantica]
MTAPGDQLLTRVVHAGSPPFDHGAAPVNVPVVRTSTVRFASDADRVALNLRREAGEPVGTYGRHGMATHRALEAAIAELEGADEVLLAPSGLSAVSLVFIALLSPGDHVLVQDSVYGPVRERVEPLLTRLGVSVSYFSASDGVPTASVRPSTRLIYAESPSSFLYEVIDLPALAAFAREHRILLAADNTWGAGLLYRPLALGADISVQAVTKYLGGHSDLMQGAVSTANPALASELRDAHDALGLSVSADDAWLALRGIRTLAVRLAQHGRNALEVAQYLQTERNAISRVFHPALPDDPGHTLWRRDFTGANGLVSFALRNADQTKAGAFVDALRLFGIGASWGGYESLALVAPPSRVCEHSFWRGDEPVVRLHIGLEDPADLIADLRQAFHRVLQ